MNNPGFNTAQYLYQSGQKPPTNEVGAVNITINGVNSPGPYSGMSQAPVYYPVYYPVQYPYPSENNLRAKNAQETPIPSVGLDKEETPEPKEKEAPEETPKKNLTPLTDELINGLNDSLTRGDKQARVHAVSKVLSLLREDPESRRNNPELIGLINTALHPSQPSVVKEAATIACDNGLVSGNEKTRAYLSNIAGKKDQYDLNTLAASALYKMPGQEPGNPAGQKLNLISQ